MEPVYEAEWTGERVVAGIDVHKKMLAVLIAAPQQKPQEYVRRKFGTTKNCWHWRPGCRASR